MSLLPEESYANADDCEGVVFPWILSVFDVTPFDVIKVLESFVTAESSFSKDIVKVGSAAVIYRCVCIKYSMEPPTFCCGSQACQKDNNYARNVLLIICVCILLIFFMDIF